MRCEADALVPLDTAASGAGACMWYMQGSPPVTFTPGNVDFDLFDSWLSRAYPVAQVVSSRVLVTAAAAPPFSCGDINAQIAAIRVLDVASGEDSRTHYYGMVSDGGFFMRGCAAGIPFGPAPATAASGPTGAGTWGWDLDGSYGDWYGGMKLGHTFGRFHPGFCGETHDDLTNYPYDNGQLGGSDASFAGFDVGDPANGVPMAPLPGTVWRDVMTYCHDQWLSAYTYLGVRRRLIDEGSSMSSASGNRGSERRATNRTAGRPDERFPRAPTPFARPSAEQREILVSVVATVNVTRDEGKIRYVNPLPGALLSGIEPESPVLLRVKSEKDQTLHSYPVLVNIYTELAPEEDREGLVDAVIAVDPASADDRARGRRKGRGLRARRRSIPKCAGRATLVFPRERAWHSARAGQGVG